MGFLYLSQEKHIFDKKIAMMFFSILLMMYNNDK